MRTTRTAACVVSLMTCLLVAGCGGGGGGDKNKTLTVTAPSGGGPATVTIDAHDVFFTPKTIKAPAGKLDIHYVDQGSQLHTLVIGGVKDFKLSVSPDDNSESGTVDLQPGKYDFYCTIPGHRAQGMEGTITVAS